MPTIQRTPILTKHRLEAIIEALAHRLAGEMDAEHPRTLYEHALDWAQAKLAHFGPPSPALVLRLSEEAVKIELDEENDDRTTIQGR